MLQGSLTWREELFMISEDIIKPLDQQEIYQEMDIPE